MDGINGSTPASGTVDCIMPPPATNVPQGSPDLAVGIVVDVEASPSEEKEQSANSAKSHSQARDMEKKKKCGGVSEVLGEQVIVGLGAVNLTPKADENEQKLSKALQHNQVKPEDESPHKSEAVLMVKKDINDRDDATSSSQHTAGTVFNLWPKHFRPMKSPPVPLTDAEVAQLMQAGLRDFRKGESARRKYLKEREEAERELVVSRLRSMGFCSQEDNS